MSAEAASRGRQLRQQGRGRPFFDPGDKSLNFRELRVQPRDKPLILGDLIGALGELGAQLVDLAQLSRLEQLVEFAPGIRLGLAVGAAVADGGRLAVHVHVTLQSATAGARPEASTGRPPSRAARAARFFSKLAPNLAARAISRPLGRTDDGPTRWRITVYNITPAAAGFRPHGRLGASGSRPLRHCDQAPFG